MSSAIRVLFLFISFNWEIIEPEAEVVDSERICSGNVLVQSTHPGPQPLPQGTSTYIVTTVYLITRKTVVVKDLVFFQLHIYTRVQSPYPNPAPSP